MYINDEPFFWWEAGAVGIDTESEDDFERKKAAPSAIERAQYLGLNVVELVGVSPAQLAGVDDDGAGLFRQIDRMIDRVTAAGAYVFMRLEFDNRVPDWYPGDVAVRQDGNRAEYPTEEYKGSFHDPRFLEMADRFIQLVAGRYAAHPFVLGYTTVYGCCNQNSYPNFGWFDFSDAALAGFRIWLADRYFEIGDLNAAWGTEFAAFDSLSFDLLKAADLDHERSPMIRDFKLFRSGTVHRVNVGLAASVNRHKGPHQLTGTFFELVAGGPGHRRGENPGMYDDAEIQVFKSASGYFHSLPWKWPGVPTGEWLGAIDNYPNWISATPYLNTRIHLNELSSAACVGRALEEQCNGATATIFNTLREPSHFSFFVLPLYPEVIVEKLKPHVEFLREMHSRYWGRNARIGVYVDVELSLLGNEQDYVRANDFYLRISRALYRLGVGHDLVYDAIVEDRLAACRYDILFAPEWSEPVLRGRGSGRVCYIAEPDSFDLEGSLRRVGIPVVNHPGFESVLLNEYAWVGLAGEETGVPFDVPLHSDSAQVHMRHIRGKDLRWEDVKLELRADSAGLESVRIDRRFESHDLCILRGEKRV
ncbi:MAG: beta-galactosidase [Verrucomicrobia bacterium]|nr:beta-galactosidase [Verrucomicrobiota bacterium]